MNSLFRSRDFRQTFL